MNGWMDAWGIDASFPHHSPCESSGVPVYKLPRNRQQASMAPPSKDLLYLVLQFLSEEDFREALHGLERETGLFFSMPFFSDLVLEGKWEEAEHYLSGFTAIEDNGSSLKMYFEIRKQKYLEALDRHDHLAAIRILKKDLRIFQSLNQEIYSELTSLLTLDDFRQNEKLAVYGDTGNARQLMLQELRSLVENNPALHEKMIFPQLTPSALTNLFQQSLQWQLLPSLPGAAARELAGALPDHLANGQFRQQPDAQQRLIQGLPYLQAQAQAHSLRASALAAAAASAAMGQGARSQQVGLAGQTAGQSKATAQQLGRKRQHGHADFKDVDPPAMLKRNRSVTEAAPSWFVADDLPTQAARVVTLPSSATSCDFHPSNHTLLLVGTVTGHALLWSLTGRECLLDISCDSKLLRSTPVARIVWSPDGETFGVAFGAYKGQGIIHLYRWSVEGSKVTGPRREINAHEGGVNDLALTSLEGQLVAVSGGSDAEVKVWNAVTGALMFRFAGHEGPVYSVCPHVKGNICFVFSTGRDGRIKAWLYDSQVAAVVDYSAPGQWWTHMAYSTDGTRLFSCGVGAPGVDSTLVEWNESDGAISRTYKGFKNLGQNLVRFDTAGNRFIIVGDEGCVKVWEMDVPSEMLLLRVEGDLPPSPVVRVNKPASLLAISTNNNTLKVLANTEGLKMLAAHSASANPVLPPRSGAVRRPIEGKLGADEVGESGSGNQEIAGAPIPSDGEIVDGQGTACPTANGKDAAGHKGLPLLNIQFRDQCVVTVLDDGSSAASGTVRSLVFASSGDALLGGADSGAHVMWRSAAPHSEAGSWQAIGPRWSVGNLPSTSRPLMDPICCLAISKNNSYMLAASGGKVSLHNLLTFKEITSFQEPPPAATSLAFHPQDNNVIALGMEDATVAIYNVRLDVVQHSMTAHSAPVTGLAFLSGGKLLVSAGKDSFICVWQASNSAGDKYSAAHQMRLQPAHSGAAAPSEGKNIVLHAHPSQSSFLVVHPQQLALYSATQGVCQQAWSPSPGSAFDEARITSATFSADGDLVYVAFRNGSIGIIDCANLQPVARLAPEVLDPNGTGVYPLCIAGQPLREAAAQLALGLSDGHVIILEPTSGSSSWLTPPPNAELPGAATPTTTAAPVHDSGEEVATIAVPVDPATEPAADIEAEAEMEAGAAMVGDIPDQPPPETVQQEPV